MGVAHAHPVRGHLCEAARRLLGHAQQLRLQRRVRLVGRVLAVQRVAREGLELLQPDGVRAASAASVQLEVADA